MEWEWWRSIGIFMIIVAYVNLFVIEREFPYGPYPSFLWGLIGLILIFLRRENNGK